MAHRQRVSRLSLSLVAMLPQLNDQPFGMPLSLPPYLCSKVWVDLIVHSCYGESIFTKFYNSVFGSIVKFFH
jgi:hypothetical protein